jgi:hypothetical protein
MGEVDGAVLEDGTVVHWPPHLADRFTAVVARGDRVRLNGWMETGPAGDTHLEDQRAINLRTSASAENDFGPPSPPPGLRPVPLPPAPAPGPFPPGASSTAEGRVVSFTTAPMGEVDGANFDDGTILHWPPHLADRFTAVVVLGDRVRATGWTERGPAGETHFEVQSPKNLRTSAIATGDGPTPPPGPRGRIAADPPDGLSRPSAPPEGVEARLKALEDQINLLREEIRSLRRQR